MSQDSPMLKLWEPALEAEGTCLDTESTVSLQRVIQRILVFPSRPFDAKNPFLAQVTENRKLNEGGERHLMHLELDISNSKIR